MSGKLGVIVQGSLEWVRDVNKRLSRIERNGGGGGAVVGEVKWGFWPVCPPGYVDVSVAQLLPIASYQALYAVYGTTFGGDGITTFGLPGLGERVPVAYLSGSTEFGTIGQTGGAKTHAHPLSDAGQAVGQITTTMTQIRRVSTSGTGPFTHQLQGTSFAVSSGTPTSGTALGGATDAASGLSPYITMRAVMKF